MAERYVVRERVRIYYESKRLATGLTDVKIDIVKTDGNKEIDQASLSELSSTNAPGVYFYDWVPTNAGTYLCYIDSLTDDYKRTMISQLDIVGRSSKYTQVMGVHGGMTQNRVTVRDTWTDKEKNDLVNTLDRLSTRLDVMSASINGLGINVDNQSNKIVKLREDNEKSKDTLRLNQITTMEQINSKLGQLDTRIEMSIAKQTIGASQVNLNFKGLNNEINSFKDSNNKLREYLDSQVNHLKDQYEFVLNNLNKLDSQFNELKDEVKDTYQIKFKELINKEININNRILSQKKIIQDIASNLDGFSEVVANKINLEKDEYSIEKRLNGIYASVHKNDKVIIYSENKEDITASYPNLIEEIKKLSDVPFILEGEIITDEKGVKLRIMDILYYNESVYNLRLKERLKVLDSLKFNEIVFNSERKIVEKEGIKGAIELMDKNLIIKSLSEPYSFEFNNSINYLKPEQIVQPELKNEAPETRVELQ